LIKLSNIDVFHDSIENNLNDVVDEIINEFKFQISKKEIKVNISIDKNILIKSNKDYFYIFISNIIANAIKYNNNK
jgi:signal transduction histidine kinase